MHVAAQGLCAIQSNLDAFTSSLLTPHSEGALPRILKRTGQTALVWTLYEELVPGLTAAYIGAVAMVEAYNIRKAAGDIPQGR